jgi:hypothetical protein
MELAARQHPMMPPRSAFAGFRFPPEVIVVAVRWYLRYGLSYRDVEELLVERGVEVDHVTVFRWVSDLHRCWPTPPGSPGIPLAVGGSSTRRISRSTACGGTCTGRLTSTGTLSTCWSRHAETPTRRGGSSGGRCPR